ncbi:DUF2314 domain-containing protein [Flavobacterium psychrotrophum]|uniref:DUF2314 domain-containing protein n=1 Tax=Flavobacterium psychrotrophum TaxID=2294119 RepID=UPI0013C4F0BE|nr:DUF2314 domain-containing protein [Flavobacterium psychrotrophum]
MIKLAIFLILLTFVIECNPQKRSVNWDRENVVTVNVNDSTYTNAEKLAQKNMSTFIDMLNNRKKNGYKFNVSARYTEDEKSETMWFTVLSIEGNTFNTKLNNVPFNLKTIKLGDKIKIPKESVRDWIVSKNHKVIAGNFANEDI